MNSTIQEWSKNHPKLTSALTVFFSIIILVAIFSSNDNEDVKTAQNQPQTFEEKLQALSIKSGSTDISYMKVEDQKADSNKPANSRMITVSYKINNFYNKSSLLKETGQLSAKAFKEIYSNNPNNYDAVIWYYGDTKDKYGNSTSSIVMTNTIDKITYSKINWDNFDSSNLCEFLRRESSINGGETACAMMVNFK